MKKLFTNMEYQKYVDSKTPKTNLTINVIKAFVVGGLICVLGQVITNLLKAKGLALTESRNLTTIILVLTGGLLTGLNIYDEIGRFAGAGSIVPITGFANSIVSPAMEFKTEGYVIGVGGKMFVIAGPVLVYGISASILVGLLYYFLRF